MSVEPVRSSCNHGIDRIYRSQTDLLLPDHAGGRDSTPRHRPSIHRPQRHYCRTQVSAVSRLVIQSPVSPSLSERNIGETCGCLPEFVSCPVEVFRFSRQEGVPHMGTTVRTSDRTDSSRPALDADCWSECGVPREPRSMTNSTVLCPSSKLPASTPRVVPPASPIPAFLPGRSAAPRASVGWHRFATLGSVRLPAEGCFDALESQRSVGASPALLPRSPRNPRTRRRTWTARAPVTHVTRGGDRRARRKGCA
jgi:hypothetical protein